MIARRHCHPQKEGYGHLGITAGIGNDAEVPEALGQHIWLRASGVTDIKEG